MIYAVTIEPLDAVFFISEPPQGNNWQVQEGVWLDVPLTRLLPPSSKGTEDGACHHSGFRAARRRLPAAG